MNGCANPIIFFFLLSDKKVFPHFYILGWYSTGTDAQESDMNIHKAVIFITFLIAYAYVQLLPFGIPKHYIMWHFQRPNHVNYEPIKGSFLNLKFYCQSFN